MILQILDDIAAQKGAKKVTMLKTHKGNELLKAIWHMTYSRTTFHTSKVFSKDCLVDSETDDMEMVLALLVSLKNKTNSGNAQRDMISTVLMRLSQDCIEVYNRVISGNLRCGVGVSAGNKVWGAKFIEAYPVMLISPHCNKKAAKIMKGGAIVQLKGDGVRGLGNKPSCSKVTFYTRQGEELHGLSRHFGPELCDIFEGVMDMDSDEAREAVFDSDGEFVYIEEDGVHNFSKASGIMNKCVLGTATDDEMKSLTYMMWDLIEPDDETIYDIRFYTMFDYMRDEAIVKGPSCIILADSWEAESIEQVHSIYRDIVKTGNEGVILKSKGNIWANKRVTDCIKYKEKHPAEMEITGHYPGDPGGEFKNVLGGYHIKSACGMVLSKTGSGLSYAERGIFSHDVDKKGKPLYRKDENGNYTPDPDFDPEDSIGNILAIEYNKRTQTKGGRETFSLRFPIVKAHRFDKSTANTMQEMIEQEQSSYGLKV